MWYRGARTPSPRPRSSIKAGAARRRAGAGAVVAWTLVAVVGASTGVALPAARDGHAFASSDAGPARSTDRSAAVSAASVTAVSEAAAACPPPPVIPTYLPWLSAGDPVPAPYVIAGDPDLAHHLRCAQHAPCTPGDQAYRRVIVHLPDAPVTR